MSETFNITLSGPQGPAGPMTGVDLTTNQAIAGNKTFTGVTTISNASVKLTTLPVFADNAAASALATGSVYQTTTGALRIKY